MVKINKNETELADLLLNNDFVDRYVSNRNMAVDVIIPLFNSNPLFEKNLLTFYKEIPIRTLYIGDGGTTDGSLDTLSLFPRVKIIDQRHMKSLAYRIGELIKLCETDYFVYLHSDVMLPKNWFDEMYNFREDYQWFESDRKMMALISWETKHIERKRPYSGSQFGKTEYVKNAISVLEDDFSYRNEDIIIGELVGLENYGKVETTFHYHQTLSTRGEHEPSVNLMVKTKPYIKRESIDWEIETFSIQWKGIVKYCQPKNYLVGSVLSSINILKKHDAFDISSEKEWVKKTNPIWVDVIFNPKFSFKNTIRTLLRQIRNKIKRM